MTSVTYSNKSSAVVQSLVKYSNEDELVYKMNYGLPNFSREWIQSSKTGVVTGNAQNIVFDIIKGGILKSMYLHLKLTAGNTASVVNSYDFGLNLIQRVSIMNNNREIAVLLPQGIRSWINKQSFGDQMKYNQAVLSVPGKTCVSKVMNIYVPLPFSFSEEPSKYLDTNYLDSLTLNVQMNAYANVVNGAVPAAPATGDISLFSEYLTLDTDAYAKYREMQFQAGKPTVFLWESYESESNTVCSTTQKITQVNLTSKRVVTETSIRVLNDTTSDGKTDNFLPVNISESDITTTPVFVRLRGNGKVLYEIKCYPYQLLESKAVYSTAVLANGSVDANTIDGNITINWRLLQAQLKDCWDGGLSLKNISGPQIEVEAGANLAATNSIMITHKYLQLIEVEPNSGRINVSQAN
jgi:hypothetical protein